LAASRQLRFGAKFSNTLEVENHGTFFQPAEKIMYLSGAPLHVITLTLANEFRQAVGGEFPISFSAGVDRKNFANVVACGIVPVTTCTDLLKTGGYGRLPPYLHELHKQMEQVRARTVDVFILDCRGQRAAADGDPVRAGFLNMPVIVAETQADTRYRAAQNRAVPKKIDSHLVTFDLTAISSFGRTAARRPSAMKKCSNCRRPIKSPISPIIAITVATATRFALSTMAPI
jgi:putative selenate reductase